ncbi:redoxin domain-containing protein [Aspergillus pseudoustus]|uniref:thioredoxin-dependent peroxiredoxin n=1 Tax=Aspergillus pseudoustus TaxID=1810923 RepID=A0ABR4ICS7_9EURO
MSLQAELESAYSDFQKAAPQPVLDTFSAGVKDLASTFNPAQAIQPGQKFPDFTLPSATGTPISSTSLLADAGTNTKGLLISFYRGEWCPFCNLELRALQKHLAEFRAAGVQLVAISPQLPDASLSVSEKNTLEFPVLSDVGNKLARELGIVWRQPESFGPIFQGFGVDWGKSYGEENAGTLEVPIPATVLVGRDGVVRDVFLDTDYTKRLEPSTALEWVRKL